MISMHIKTLGVNWNQDVSVCRQQPAVLLLTVIKIRIGGHNTVLLVLLHLQTMFSRSKHPLTLSFLNWTSDYAASSHLNICGLQRIRKAHMVGLKIQSWPVSRLVLGL